MDERGFRGYVPVSLYSLANLRALSRRRCLSRGQSLACLSQVHLRRLSLTIFILRSTLVFENISLLSARVSDWRIFQFKEPFLFYLITTRLDSFSFLGGKGEGGRNRIWKFRRMRRTHGQYSRLSCHKLLSSRLQCRLDDARFHFVYVIEFLVWITSYNGWRIYYDLHVTRQAQSYNQNKSFLWNFRIMD